MVISSVYEYTQDDCRKFVIWGFIYEVQAIYMDSDKCPIREGEGNMKRVTGISVLLAQLEHIDEKDKGGGIYHTKAVAECIEPDRFRSLCCELISGKCLKP